MSLVLSTSWNAANFDKAEDMLFEIKELGFTDLELSFNLTAAMVSGISSFLGGGGFRIRSAHNFCPIPETFKRADALPDCYSMASLDEEERKNALKYAKRTIAIAGSLGASAVVLHCGRVQMPDRTRELIDLYRRGLKDTQEFRSAREEFIRARASLARPFFEQALRSLEELNKYAEEKSVDLGVENRFYYREIPNLEELGVILGKFRPSRVFYWHDTGHARIMENLGFAGSGEYLRSCGQTMVGTHIHNVIGCVDHQAPCNGELDFSELKPYLKKETLKVIEAHQPAAAKDLKKSKALLERIFDGIL